MSLTPPQTRHIFDAHKPNENCSLLYFLPARHYLIVALLLLRRKRFYSFDVITIYQIKQLTDFWGSMINEVFLSALLAF